MGKSKKRRQRHKKTRENHRREDRHLAEEANATASSFHEHSSSKSLPLKAKETAHATEQELVDFESRKRSRRQLEFVYPRKNGTVVPYNFEKKGKATTSHGGAVSEETSNSNVTEVNQNCPTSTNYRESLDEILSSSSRTKQTKDSEEKTPTAKSANNVAVVENTRSAGNEIEGKLSGLSVEEVVRDKSGCRPRANSTDGELNLPRRGLCDEHMVLQAHKWDLSGQQFRSSPKGLLNLGNTCFLNSTLQCLAYLPPFCQSIMAIPDRISNENGQKMSQGKKITFMLRSLFRKIHGSDGNIQAGAIAPQSVVKAVPSLGTYGSRNGYKFRPGRQEDAHEFLVYLLDAMNDGELREAGINQHASGWRDRLPIPRLDETTFVHRIFGGYLRSQVKCTKCGYSSNTYDPFLDLALEVSKNSITSVAEAFQEFSRKETLDSENKWQCSGCKKRVCATKQLTVFRPPLSLCVQMKRFTFGGLGSFGFSFGGFHSKKFGGRGHKVTKPIAFPSEMKLPLSDGRSCEYALTGMVIHVGGSADSGHYTAYVKKAKSGGSTQWYHMDDSFVEAVSEKTVLRERNAYLLFYCRKEVKLEFPAPPPRGSMSAQEAAEHGRARARARSDSWPKFLEKRSSISIAAEVNSDKAAAPPPISSTTLNAVEQKCGFSEGSGDKGDNKRSGIRQENENQLHTENMTSQRGSSTKKAPESSSESSSDDSSDASSDAFGTEQNGQREDKRSPTIEVQQQPEHKLVASNRQSACKSAPNLINTSDQGKSSAGKILGSSSSSDSDSTSSSSSSSFSSSDDETTLKKASSRTEVAGSDMMGRAKPDLKAKKKPSLTSVKLDRGSGREKISVVVGRKSNNERAWNPQTTGTTRQGQEYELLGNRVVDKWDDEDVSPAQASGISVGRSQMVSVMEKKDRALKRKTYLDSWDATLDRGRGKKIKQKHANVDSSGPTQNSFQRILSGLQKIKHVRPKGFVGKGSAGKHNKKRRKH